MILVYFQSHASLLYSCNLIKETIIKDNAHAGDLLLPIEPREKFVTMYTK